MKTITTGTEITFKKTGDKFTLTHTETGFDLLPVKLSKNLTGEPYSFQEFLELYEAGKILIEGFEQIDQELVKSMITNFIHTTEIAKKDTDLREKNEALKLKISEAEGKDNQISELETEIHSLKEENGELQSRNLELNKENTRLTQAVEAMQD